MELFLFRHAIAEEPGPDINDADRAVTREGARRFKDAVKGLEKLEIGFDIVLHSPLRRSVQTAELLLPLVRAGGLVVTPFLSAPPDEQLLSQFVGLRVGAVGHEPHLGNLVSWLVTGSVEAGDRFPFKKGALYWLEGMPLPGKMRIKAALPPKVLRAIS